MFSRTKEGRFGVMGLVFNGEQKGNTKGKGQKMLEETTSELRSSGQKYLVGEI